LVEYQYDLEKPRRFAGTSVKPWGQLSRERISSLMRLQFTSSVEVPSEYTEEEQNTAISRLHLVQDCENFWKVVEGPRGRCAEEALSGPDAHQSVQTPPPCQG
jgi:alanyl-tRNA synthetase